MTVGRAFPCLRARIVAVAIAGALASLTVAVDARAQAPLRQLRAEHPVRPLRHRYLPPHREPLAAPAPASTSASIVRTASSPGEFGEHQRDGHMTPDERRLLRQHIEDAVRELYRQ